MCLPPKVQKGVGLSRLCNKSIELQNSVARSINDTKTMISACESVSRNNYISKCAKGDQRDNDLLSSVLALNLQ